MRARWLSFLFFGFVLGASVVLLADGGDSASDGASSPSSLAAATGAQASGPLLHNHNPDQLAELQPDKPLERATRDKLAQQLVRARAVAMQYPTVADAEGAGFYRAGKFAPGVGAHYVSRKFSMTGAGEVDVDHPLALIYDGTSPTSRIVGIMYYSFATSQPAGFAGPNDHWHRHQGVCVKYGASGIDVPLPADADVTARQCYQVGGTFMAQTAWMLHAWVVPGWESPQGVFSHSNPNLLCADGTANTDRVGFCQGT